jgi:signal transduction histidine kinase
VVGVSDDRLPSRAVPGPTATYRLRDGRPVLSTVDPAFDRAFAATETGTPVAEFWRTNDLTAEESSVEAVVDALAAGDAVEATVPRPESGGRYRLRATPGDGGEDGGHLVAVETAADAAVEAERIARVVSHDLRNPLDVARARLRAARESGDADPAHLDHVARAHDRMERIVEDVLTLARGETALSVSDGVAVDRVAADAWDTVDTDGAELSVGDDLPTVAADPDRLRRLFENLYRNSVEHGRPAAPDADGRPAVLVRVEATDEGFAVVDDGTGVPAGDRERVFDPGHSTDDSGTGLGLTIVERIATAHGWTVAMTESASGGARVAFRVRD